MALEIQSTKQSFRRNAYLSDPNTLNDFSCLTVSFALHSPERLQVFLGCLFLKRISYLFFMLLKRIIIIKMMMRMMMKIFKSIHQSNEASFLRP